MDWKKQRQQSYFYNMRKFHNNIKRDLYNKYSKNTSVLELAFGKGADLGKLFDNKVNRVIGYDIDDISVVEAKRRLMEYPIDFQKKVSLYTKDLSNDIVKGEQDFDVISCMFAFHYFLMNQDTFYNIFDTINNNLKIGGIFMGTCFDGNLVKQRLTKPFTDEHFKIELVSLNEGLFGNKINVKQIDNLSSSIYNPSDEYLVDFEKLTTVMRMLGYDLIDTKLFRNLNSDKFTLKYTEKDVSYLNRYFVFEKKVNITERLECIHKLIKY